MDKKTSRKIQSGIKREMKLHPWNKPVRKFRQIHDVFTWDDFDYSVDKDRKVR